MNWQRPPSKTRPIASHCRAGGSQRNFLRPWPNRRERGLSRSIAFISSGATSAACRRRTRRAIFCSRRPTCSIHFESAAQPGLDLIFLGLGEDGHVASLFPGAPDEVVRNKSIYLPVLASKPPPQRITICFATIAAARQVWVLASGPAKENALRESLSANGQTPLARVLQSRDKTIIFTDIPKQDGRPADRRAAVCA